MFSVLGQSIWRLNGFCPSGSKTREPIRFVPSLLILLLTHLSGTFSEDAKCDGGQIKRVYAAGVTNSRFILLAHSHLKSSNGVGEDAHCLYEMPSSALDSSALKVYLHGGVTLKEKWPSLESVFGSTMVNYNGIVIQDSASTYIYLTNNDEADSSSKTPRQIWFNLKDKIPSKNKLPLEMSGGSTLSSRTPLEYYNVREFQLSVMKLSGSKVFTEVTQSQTNKSVLLCSSGKNQLNTKEGSSNCNEKLNWNPSNWGGFSDGKHFYLPGDMGMYIFSTSAIGTNLGKSVSFTKVNMSSFYVYGSSPNKPRKDSDNSNKDNTHSRTIDKGKGSSSTLWVLIIVIVVLLIGASAVYFLWYKPKEKEKEEAKSKEDKKGGNSKGKEKDKNAASGKGNATPNVSKAVSKNFKLSKGNSISRGTSSKSKRNKKTTSSRKLLPTKASSSRNMSTKNRSSKNRQTPSSSRKMSSRKASKNQKNPISTGGTKIFTPLSKAVSRKA